MASENFSHAAGRRLKKGYAANLRGLDRIGFLMFSALVGEGRLMLAISADFPVSSIKEAAWHVINVGGWFNRLLVPCRLIGGHAATYVPTGIAIAWGRNVLLGSYWPERQISLPAVSSYFRPIEVRHVPIGRLGLL